MNLGRARPIADAILYEGYALYPYRGSSLKNQRRWMFGSLSPRGHSEARGGQEPCRLECQGLIEARPGAAIEAKVRFLELVSRTRGDRVSEEAVEREVDAGPLPIDGMEGGSARRHRQSFSFGAIAGEVELAAETVARGVARWSVRIENLTPFGGGDGPEEARLLSLASAQAVLGAVNTGFISLLDPPESLRSLAEGCHNRGAWPVLVGEKGARDLVLCSPIILEDHPAVAPESPGDLFDGTEMDEMLTLRILTLSEAERREAAASDPRVRALLARTEGLAPEALERMHGAVRSRRIAARAVLAGGVEVGAGDRVRLRPRGRSDIFDLALAGMAATIVSIERDFEDRTFVAVTVDDDPGRDLGERGMPGHRFFFSPDEIEPFSRSPEEAR